jgi:hypothetical protein
MPPVTNILGALSQRAPPIMLLAARERLAPSSYDTGGVHHIARRRADGLPAAFACPVTETLQMHVAAVNSAAKKTGAIFGIIKVFIYNCTHKQYIYMTHLSS